MRKSIIVILLVSAMTVYGTSQMKSVSFVADDIPGIKLWDDGEIPFFKSEDAGKKERLYPCSWDTRPRVTDVTIPEIYCFPAPGKAAHPAVLVAPGGGYSYLSWEHEGIEICRMFQRQGFTAFLLKYRCPGRRQAAFADAARAIRLIRYQAEKFNILPDKVGAVGFSAGAHLCAVISAPANEPYPEKDEVDKGSFRPDFTALIYPAFLTGDMQKLTLKSEFKVDEKTPPALLIQTGDDPIRVENSLAWYRALQAEKIKCEMHIWDKGGHGYGIWLKDSPVADWPLPAVKWFKRQLEK
ncbi:MAG: alpha/beta hydrolase [Lentisphaerae bacterium]|nr:alpha/beta hydrolase [Lentisphaerota bacterium]